MASKIRRVFSYLQYQVKLASEAVPLKKEPVAAPLTKKPYPPPPPFHDQVSLLNCKVQSLDNNKDITNGLKQKNKDNIKNLSVTVFQNQAFESVQLCNDDKVTVMEKYPE